MNEWSSCMFFFNTCLKTSFCKLPSKFGFFVHKLVFRLLSKLLKNDVCFFFSLIYFFRMRKNLILKEKIQCSLNLKSLKRSLKQSQVSNLLLVCSLKIFECMHLSWIKSICQVCKKLISGQWVEAIDRISNLKKYENLIMVHKPTDITSLIRLV